MAGRKGPRTTARLVEERIVMKTLPLTLVLVTGLVAGSVTSAAAQNWGNEGTPRNGACFYRDANFRGPYFCMQAGDNAGNLSSSVRAEISSIRVFGNVEVSTFDRGNFRGETRRFDQDA